MGIGIVINVHRSDHTMKDESAKQDEGEQPTEQEPISLSSSASERGFEDEILAYLAYILKEAELTRARLGRMHRDILVTNLLLAVGIFVLIIVWLDITGVLPLF